jgi:TPR repeat protein
LSFDSLKQVFSPSIADKLMKIASQGNIEAMVELGIMHEKGNDVNKDEKESEKNQKNGINKQQI